jgi:hypothetical protein
VTASLPVELRADAVVLLRGVADKLAVVVEVQTSAGDLKGKRRVWLAYLNQARAQHDCPAALMVFRRDRAIARSCRKAIPTGHPEFVLTPIVIGPGGLPAPVRRGTAAAELAMMAAWASSSDLRDPEVQVRTLRLIAGLDAETLATYTRIVLIAAPDESSRRALEALMATVFKNEFVDKLQAEGRAQMILQVLAARHIAVPAEVREQVLTCTDIAQLDSWGTKAATAQSIEEVFGGANGAP